MLEAKTEIPRWMPTDRRAGQDRRSVERRRLAIEVPTERRKSDRRQDQRRSGTERRTQASAPSEAAARHTLLPYSRGEAEQLKLGIRAGKPACPSCGQATSEGPALTRGDHSVREYRCMPCRKGVMVRQG